MNIAVTDIDHQVIAEANAKKFFADARERHNIYLKKSAGLPKPWTDDPIMQSIYLCNVFRELDKTTAWFRDNVRGPNAEDPIRSLAFTVLFRWFNRIETGEFLWREHDYAEQWFQMIKNGTTPEVAGEWLFNKIDTEAFPPYFTGAYMIKLENGVIKHLSVAMAAGQVLYWFMKYSKDYGTPILFNTLREWNNWFKGFNGLGGFMAYEIVSDLRWTCLAREAIDINLWTNIGPGSARGLSRIYYNDYQHYPEFFKNPDLSLQIMRWLLDLSRQGEYWPQNDPNWPKWEIRECEHQSCEWDKIQRARLGEGRIKRKYNGAG